MQLPIPAEILRHIVRIATDIPGMLDTSSPDPFDTSSSGQAPEMAAMATEMFAFKCNLLRVSRLFYSVTEEFMYEYIVLYDLDQLFPLLRSLETLLTSTEHKVFRGERCKRLEISFGQRSPRRVLSQMDQQLLWVYHGVGKLFMTCPNLQVLMINFGPFITTTDVGVSESLWMHIAARLKSLRVLSVSSILIYEGDVLRLLSAIKSLERLRIHVTNWKNTSVPPPIRTVRLFRPDDLAQCLFALQSTQWPRTRTDSVTLPKLHALELLGCQCDFLAHIELPALRMVTIPPGPGIDEKYFRALGKWKNQITRLVISCEGRYPSMWEALQIFPMVRDLTAENFNPHFDVVYHPLLQVMRFKTLHPYADTSLKRLVDGGKLNGLREIVLLEVYQSTIDENMATLVEQFAQCGVQLRSNHPDK